MTLFLLLGILGVGMLVLGLVGGELLDGLFDAIGVDASGGFFSTEVIGGFLAAFGLGAWLLDSATGVGTVLAMAGGGVAGVAMGGAALWLSRSLINMPTDATPTSADLRGAIGRVISTIPEGGLGQVSVRTHGHPLNINARAETELPVGTEVIVVDVLSSTAVLVAPAGFDMPVLELDPEPAPQPQAIESTGQPAQLTETEPMTDPETEPGTA